jgi:hypothetical protein
MRFAFASAVVSAPAFAAVLAVLLAAVPDARAEQVYAEKGATVTHDCAKEPEVSITGGGGTYTFTGACTKLVVTTDGTKLKAESVTKIAVTGSKNSLEVDAVDRVSVNGNENTVTYRRGVNGKPKAATTGINNKLNQVK